MALLVCVLHNLVLWIREAGQHAAGLRLEDQDHSSHISELQIRTEKPDAEDAVYRVYIQCIHQRHMQEGISESRVRASISE